MACISGPDARLWQLLDVLIEQTHRRLKARSSELTGLSGGATDLLLAGTTAASPTLQSLSAAVGISASGGWRAAATLETFGLMERRWTGDNRRVAVELTSAGQQLGTQVIAGRAEVLERAVHALSAADRLVLADLLAAMLTDLPLGPGQREELCWRCNVEICGGGCPVAAAATRSERGLAHLRGG